MTDRSGMEASRRNYESGSEAFKAGRPKTTEADATAPGLLPCPFCGKQPESFPSGDGSGLMIECFTPGCVNPHCSWVPPDSAIAAWNTRADIAAEAIAEAVKAAVEVEREAAATIADDLYGQGPSGSYDNGGTMDGWDRATVKIAAAIRARNPTEGA